MTESFGQDLTCKSGPDVEIEDDETVDDIFLQARFHPLPDDEEEDGDSSSIQPTSPTPPSQPTSRDSSPILLSSGDETQVEEDMIDQYEDVKVRFNLVIGDLKPNSSHTFKSLTPFERSKVHTLAEKAGLAHWTEEQRVHPDRPYKIKVTVVSNKDADRVNGRHLIANAVQASTVVDIPTSPSVAEVLAPVARSVVKDTGPWICTTCERNDFKSKAGWASHMRLKHPQ
jgi:hypothetical protein